MAGREVLDISPKQRKILEFRAARRTQLRAQYLEHVGNPSKMGTEYSNNLLDLGIHRYQSMRETAYDHFRPNKKNSIFTLCSVVLPITFTLWWIKKSRNATEQSYRTGQVSYRDRPYKFV